MTRKRLHAEHGHQNPEPPIVFSAVTNGVVMAPRHQSPSPSRRRCSEVDPDHVTDRIDLDRIEAAVVPHPVHELASARAVRLRQVGHGQFAALGVARVPILGQGFGPFPDLVPQGRLDTKFFIKPDFSDAVDIAQTLCKLVIRGMRQAPGEGVDNRLPAKTQAPGASNRKNEGPAESGVVPRVERLDLFELLRAAIGQARGALLMARLCRQRLGHHRFTGEFRMCAHQFQLLRRIGLPYGLHQRLL